MFGTVSPNGKLEIWDLENSSLDPTITHSVLDRQLTCILFGACSPIVVTGDDYGVITVYKLCKQGAATEDPNSIGFISPYAAGSSTDEEVKAWKQQQSQALQDMITSKINSSSLVGT
jgi:WD40 repeat protein